MSGRQGIVVGISGASGAAIGMRIVELLADDPHYAVHLVVSPAAERTLSEEVGSDALARLRALAFRHHLHSDVGAAIASGSYPVAGMIVAPCSIRTLSADVQLKERRRLVLLVRESPLHLGHLRSMLQATEIGAIIAPPMPAFYLRPQSLDEMIDQIAGRAINLLDLTKLRAPAKIWSGSEGT
jgi:4-hydroxy-3-polyprenylbenzoate decarboxylase